MVVASRMTQAIIKRGMPSPSQATPVKRFKPIPQATTGPVGEVRFDQPSAAHDALQLNGSTLQGAPIKVLLDMTSKDQSKIIVTGLLDTVEWQELKDHFAACGSVAFANIKGSKNESTCTGTVRYESPAEASQAVAMLDGSVLGQRTVTVKLAQGSRDGTRLNVYGIPASVQWQELKDHFGQAGTVAFAEVNPGAPPGMDPSGVETLGEVRYERAEDATTAMTSLNGSFLGGSRVFVRLDPKSQDATKLVVHGVQPGTEWQELKDHFSHAGAVAFCNIRSVGVAGGMVKSSGMMGGMIGGMMGGMAKGMMPSAAPMGGKGKGNTPTLTGEVRYHTPLHTQMAMNLLNGSSLMGSTLFVDWDPKSHDGTKLVVRGIHLSLGWQELKDHFSTIGPVAFAEIKGKPSKGGGK